MTGLDIMKIVLHELALPPRTLTPDEILDLLESAVEGDWTPRSIINFPMPVPQWTSNPTRPGHVVRAWAWESKYHLFVVAELPEEWQGMLPKSSLQQLNRRTEMAGRFFEGKDYKAYYVNPQVIDCKTGNGSGPIDLLQLKVARETAKRLVLLSLAGAVKDLSLGIHILTNCCNSSVRNGFKTPFH